MLMTTVLGFAALSVDIGYLYTVRAELQISADAAALAAAGKLASLETDRLDMARAMATEYAYKNKVANRYPILDQNTDVVFGQAVLDPQTGMYSFVPDAAIKDAVRVRVRLTQDSPNGPVELFFANIFGRSEKDLWAEATAILTPRDIAIVADLSASHNDDSELRHINRTSVNLHAVWAALPGGVDELDPNWSPQNAGPLWGAWMEQAGFGETVLDSTYDPTADTGLVHLPRYQNWNDAWVESRLRAQNYNEQEIDALMGSSYDNQMSSYKARTCVALGLAVWRSGKGSDPDGTPPKWEVDGLSPGNGNDWVSYDYELDWAESFPYTHGSWGEWVAYMDGSSSMRNQGHSDLEHRYGVKTFINYMLENRRSYHECPEFKDTPHQPMQAVKEAVEKMMQIIDDLETDDRVSLEVYCEDAYHEVDLTSNFSAVSTRLTEMQAGHYEVWTNMGGGIETAVAELTGPRTRDAATKVMVLLTDGKANVTEWGDAGDYYNGPLYALSAAQSAADLGIRIYAVSVGSDADTDTMEEIAEIGRGMHFHASGSIDQYTEQLQQIFETLGGKRPVMLIQ